MCKLLVGFVLCFYYYYQFKFEYCSNFVYKP